MRSGFGIRAGSDTGEGVVHDGKAFFADVERDTDLLIMPAPTGVAFGLVLRSEDSPERVALTFTLPEGLRLRLPTSRPGAAELVDGDDVIAVVAPPAAWDAEGEPIEASYAVVGDVLELRVRHREADLAYPVAVDPLIDHFQIDDNEQRVYPQWPESEEFEGWTSSSNALDKFTTETSGIDGNGLYIHTKLSGASGGIYDNGDYAQWAYTAPGQSYIERADFGYVDHSPPGIWDPPGPGGPDPNAFSCIHEGIWAPSRNAWDNGRWTQRGSTATGTSPWLGNQGAGVANGCVSFSGDYKRHFPDSATNNPDGMPTIGNRAIFKFRMSGDGVRTTRGTAHMHGALIYLNDKQNPTITSPVPPSGWTDDDGGIWATAVDAGLGVHHFDLSGETHAHGCTGDHTARCPTTWSKAFAFPEGRTTKRLTAYDALGKPSQPQDWDVRIDRTAPSVTVTGSLRAAENQRLSEPSYQLQIDARDGTDEDPRSGVKSIEVQIDGARKDYVENSCDSSGCPQTLNRSFTYQTDAYGPGPHRVTVLVNDHLNHTFRTEWSVDTDTASETDECTNSEPPHCDVDPSEADRAPLERVSMSQNNGSADVDLYVWNAQGDPASPDSPTAIPDATLDGGHQAGSTERFVDDYRDRELLVGVCYQSGSGQADVSLTLRSPDGSEASFARTVEEPGDRAVIETSRPGFEVTADRASWLDCPEPDGQNTRAATEDPMLAVPVDVCALPLQPDYCYYDQRLADWQRSLESAVDAARPGALTASAPAPPTRYRAPATCAQNAAGIKACFDAADAWQKDLEAWLVANGVGSDLARDLPPMPVFDEAADPLAEDLTTASAGIYDITRAGLEGSNARARWTISFDGPVSEAYLQALAAQTGATEAFDVRGTYVGNTVLTAGFSAPLAGSPGELVQNFYGTEIESLDTILRGLNHALTRDETAADRVETQRIIFDNQNFQAALQNRLPAVTSIVMNLNDAALLTALHAQGSPIQAITSPMADHGARINQELAPIPPAAARLNWRAAAARMADSTPLPTLGAPMSRASQIPRSEFMPRTWHAFTSLKKRTHYPYVKEVFLDFQWEEAGTLDYYQGDDHHDRGFEAEGYPVRRLWSTNWSGSEPRRGCLWTDRRNCEGNWNSNMPDPYRDDLANDGRIKVFAIGSADGKSLEYGTRYYAYYLTNHGETAKGATLVDGQATRRGKVFRGERGYCNTHRRRDAACFFANETARVGWYPINHGSYDFPPYN